MSTTPQDLNPARIVLTEAMQLQATRELLKAAERRTRATAYDLASADAYDYGKLGEALYQAEAAVFNALNVAAAYCDCQASERALRVGRENG